LDVSTALGHYGPGSLQAQGVVWLAETGAGVPAGMPAVIVGVGRLPRRGPTSRAVEWSRRIGPVK